MVDRAGAEASQPSSSSDAVLQQAAGARGAMTQANGAQPESGGAEAAPAVPLPLSQQGAAELGVQQPGAAAAEQQQGSAQLLLALPQNGSKAAGMVALPPQGGPVFGCRLAAVATAGVPCMMSCARWKAHGSSRKCTYASSADGEHSPAYPTSCCSCVEPGLHTHFPRPLQALAACQRVWSHPQAARARQPAQRTRRRRPPPPLWACLAAALRPG